LELNWNWQFGNQKSDEHLHQTQNSNSNLGKNMIPLHLDNASSNPYLENIAKKTILYAFVKANRVFL
jgi:hypothetical protein